jgi:hypothetical protein
MTRIIIVFLCIVCSTVVYGDTSLSGEEILTRLKKAKENFYGYKDTNKSGGTSHSFAQSRPTDEILWTERTIVSDSNKNKPSQSISIVLGYEKMYNYYPDSNVAVDISYLLQKIKENATNEKKELDTATVQFEPIKEIKYDNIYCYDVKTASIKDGKTIAKEHYIIDKNTFLPRLYEGSKLGKTFKYQYQDIRFEPELSIDFFKLPEGVIIKKATNNEEFMAVMKEIDLIRNPPPKIDSIEENKAKLEAKFSSKERAILAETQKKLTLQDELARIDKEREAQQFANAQAFEKKDRTQQFIILIIVDLIVILLVVYYYYWRRKASK